MRFGRCNVLACLGKEASPSLERLGSLDLVFVRHWVFCLGLRFSREYVWAFGLRGVPTIVTVLLNMFSAIASLMLQLLGQFNPGFLLLVAGAKEVHHANSSQSLL